MSEPHERLDQAMEDRRLELRMSWTALARKADISPQALRSIRRGEYRPSRITARALERALEWERGSVERILAGGEPGIVVYGSAHLGQPSRMTASAASGGRLTDEQIINSGLQPETVEAILRMRRRIERLLAERDEEAIRRMDRVTGAALDEEADAS